MSASKSRGDSKVSSEPYLEILIQPQSKFRFRYKSEMTGKHGCLLGVGSSVGAGVLPPTATATTSTFLPSDKNSALIQSFQNNFSVNSVNNLNQPGSSLDLGTSAQYLYKTQNVIPSGLKSGSGSNSIHQNIPVSIRKGMMTPSSSSSSVSVDVSDSVCKSGNQSVSLYDNSSLKSMGSAAESSLFCASPSLSSPASHSHSTTSTSNIANNGLKVYPTVKLHNFPHEAIIRCTLVHETAPYSPHPHILAMSRLLGMTESSTSISTLTSTSISTSTATSTSTEDDSTGFAKNLPIEIPVSADTSHIAVFQGLNIIYTGKKGMRTVLEEKLSQLEEGDKRRIPHDQIDTWVNNVNLNSVSLYFEAFRPLPPSASSSSSSATTKTASSNPNSSTSTSIREKSNDKSSSGDIRKLVPICNGVISNTIHHNKSTQTGDLRIVRIDKLSSPMHGDEEVFILVEKIDKHNIQVKFYQENDKGLEIWKAYGKFSKLDVHHQYCIVFKTPPYRTSDIDFEVQVFIQLERPSDGATSPPIPFKYKPIERLRKMPKRQVPRGGGENSGGPSSSSGGNGNGNGRPPSGSGSSGQGSSSSSYSNNNSGSTQNNQGPSSCSQSVRQGSTQKFPCDTTQLNLGELGGNVGTTNVAFTAALSVGEGLHSWAETSNFNVLLHKLRHLLCLVDENGDNALHAAISNKQKEPFLQILKIMTSSPDVSGALNEPNIHNETPISLAVCSNCPDFVQELSERNADLTIPNLDGDNPLHLAVKTNNIACLRALLRSNKISSVINRFNYSSMTPLHIAVANGFLEATEMICRAGASLTVQEGTFGRSPLHLAVEKGSITATMLLIQAAGVKELAKIGNIQNYRGDTPLHVAASSGLVAICAILLYYGADPTIENYIKKEGSDSDLDEVNVGQTAIDCAANDEVLKTLCGSVEIWEKHVKTCSQLLDSRMEKDKKNFSLDSLQIDSGIDIKDHSK